MTVGMLSKSASVVAIGGAGALQPTANLLLSPDTGGLSRFSVDASGTLALVDTDTSTSALINGQVAVEYRQGLLLASGENDPNEDLVTSHTLDLSSGATTPVQSHTATGSEAGIDGNSSFQNIEIGRSGRVMYVLDEDIFDSTAVPRPTGFVRVYNYDEFGNFSTTASDVQAIGQGPDMSFISENSDIGTLGLTRWNTIHNNPPLVISEDDLAHAFRIIDNALYLADEAYRG